MSKKNNKHTRQRHLQAAVQKEKQELAKRKEKLEKKQKQKSQLAVAAAPTKKKFKGVRIKKNVVVRGIKVKDSESKKKVKEVLLAEQAMREMMVDAPSTTAAAAPSEKMVVG